MRSPYLILAFSAVFTACAVGIVVEGLRSATDVGVLLLLIVHAQREYQRAAWGFVKRKFIRRVREFLELPEPEVRESDHRHNLETSEEEPDAAPSLPRWRCPQCSVMVHSDWDSCRRCGRRRHRDPIQITTRE